jgi:drug/metabolite transporter (DMT)-like permease
VSDGAPGRGAFVPRPAIGILFMLGSATLFPIMNGFVKMLSADYASEQIIWARNATHLLFVLALFAPRRGWTIFRTRRPGLQFARSLLLLLSTICFFTAVKYIDLGKAATIQFVAPFIVTLMAWRLLGERLSAPRLAAVGLGFLGAVIVIRPGSSVFQWADLLPLGSSFFYAAYQVCTRFVADKDTAETSVVYSALIGTAAMALTLPFVWKTPATAFDIVVMSGLGVLGGIGHYCIARAMQHAEASVVSPFNYWQIVGSSAFGLIVFGEVPDAFVWTGAAVIVAAGGFMALQEARPRGAGRASAAGPPSRG